MLSGQDFPRGEIWVLSYEVKVHCAQMLFSRTWVMLQRWGWYRRAVLENSIYFLYNPCMIIVVDRVGKKWIVMSQNVE